VGSSHNRPTSAEDHEEALLLGCPPIGRLDESILCCHIQKNKREGRALSALWPHIPGFKSRGFTAVKVMSAIRIGAHLKLPGCHATTRNKQLFPSTTPEHTRQNPICAERDKKRRQREKHEVSVPGRSGRQRMDVGANSKSECSKRNSEGNVQGGRTR